MTKHLLKINKAADLPDAWDTLADCYFQKIVFFKYTEKYNACDQRYYLLYDDDIIVAGACVYTITLDLLTFLQVKSPMKMQIVGIPATVSPKGIIGDDKSIELLLKEIFKVERGLLVGMNLEPELDCTPAIAIKTMPTIILKHQLKNKNEYPSALRTDYRRRLKKVESKFNGVEITKADCSIFDEELYNLYEQIYDRSKSKMEKLSLPFFKNLPDKFKLTVYSKNNQYLAWHITLKDNDVIYFFFGGTNYPLNKKYNSYFNNIAGLVKVAYDDTECKVIELGQTAEIPKTRLGGKVYSLNLFLYHRNQVIKFLLSVFKPLLQYNRKIPETHVFKIDN